VARLSRRAPAGGSYPIQLDAVEHSDFLELEIRLDLLPGNEILWFRFGQNAVRLFSIEPILLVLSAKPLQQMEISPERSAMGSIRSDLATANVMS
jgi:hypothetical protein